jgi:hypothetical protein
VESVSENMMKHKSCRLRMPEKVAPEGTRASKKKENRAPSKLLDM